MSLLVWALLLLLLGCIFLVLEFFVPSSGTLGVLAGLSLLGAIVLAFMAGPVQGSIMLLAVMVIVPTACILAVNYWPETPIGRMILIQRPASPDEVLPETEQYRGMDELVGKVGIAKCEMLPGGVVEIEHKSYDAVSDGAAIDPGERVVVVGVSTQRIVVRRHEGDLSVERLEADLADAELAQAELVPSELAQSTSASADESLPSADSTAAAAAELLAKDFENPFGEEKSA